MHDSYFCKVTTDINLISLFFPAAAQCPSLTTPLNSLITYSPDTTPPYDYLTTATYECTTGYGLTGGDKLRACIGSTAVDDGWTGDAPSCTSKNTYTHKNMLGCKIIHNYL